MAVTRRPQTDLGSRLDRGITLPFEWFSDPGIFRREQGRVFADSWVYAGVTDWATETGQYFTAHAGLVPIVVVRDEHGDLNGFVNICRHRATQVAEGRGRRMSLQCPYHAWTYGLDGRLRQAPRSELEAEFDRADFGLVPVAVDTWGPFVFVNRNLDAPPLATYLGRLPQIVADAGVDFARMRFRGRDESEIAANWKAVVENYLECYHCPTAHPSFSRVIDVNPENYALTSDEWFSSQVGRTRPGAERENGGLPYNPVGPVAEAHFHWLWPTFTINVLPGAPNLTAFYFIPLAPDRTLAVSDSFYGDEVTEQEIASMNEFGNQVFMEDQALVESIQQAAASGGLTEGRLMLSSEHLIQHFQKLVERALA
jgi:phenylpropionate dioxygenase-like ring-hydroxylating dioxygenase large terminal subunit